MKKFRIFFSWQADLPSNQTKRFLEDSINIAKDSLSETIEIIPDEATRERFGAPDVMDSIFDKIDECDLFIADVSIVGNYIPPKFAEKENAKFKFFPNPNVLLELGYAAASKTWNRCICFANTEYGDISDLPFDLNHRRITAFSYSEGGRRAELLRIAEIIVATVHEYIHKPLPKKDCANHIIGGYNFDSKTIEQCIIPYNDFAITKYEKHSKEILEEIKSIVDKITLIHLPQRKKKQVENKCVPSGMPVGEIMKDPVLAKEFLLKIMDFHDVNIDYSFIYDCVRKHFNLNLCDDFCDLGGLQQKSSLVPHSSPSLEGTDQEKEKYNLLIDLQARLATVDIREMFSHMFDDVCIIPLAIKNISRKNDERITVFIKVTKGCPIQPTASFFNQEYTGLEGSVYDNHLVKEVLQLPENEDITHDTSYSRELLEPYSTSLFRRPMIDGFGFAIEPDSNENDYEKELQDYVQIFNDESGNEYCFNIGALRPNEAVWLDKVMLIKPVDGQIVLKYSIKSNNTTGEISDTLYLNQLLK